MVWWEKGYYGEEDAALAEIISGFRARDRQRADRACHETAEIADKILAALLAHAPPDLAFA
jgi:hypothetical protein